MKKGLNWSISFNLDQEFEGDLVLKSSDGVYFSVHRNIIGALSIPTLEVILAFASVSSDVISDAIDLPELSITLHIILHAVYNTSCARSLPTIEDLIDAVDKMPTYHLQPSVLVHPNNPLFGLILSHAPVKPLEIYTLAGHHRIMDLAVAVSEYLLAYPLHAIDDATAESMGAPFLKLLFGLHMDRMAALRDIVLAPPKMHTPNMLCNEDGQQRMQLAWAHGATDLVWAANPATSKEYLRKAFWKYRDTVECDECRQQFDSHLLGVLDSWGKVKV